MVVRIVVRIVARVVRRVVVRTIKVVMKVQMRVEVIRLNDWFQVVKWVLLPDGWTDGRTNEQTLVIVELLSRLKSRYKMLSEILRALSNMFVH